MRFLPILIVFSLATSALSACDTKDYWLIDETITVNSDSEIFTASNTAPISQELFVRYQLDYQVENLSNQATEVVVSATSYVNDIERATAQKIWHLEASESGEGILTPEQIQLGNSLVVSLNCCNKSQCSRSSVLCPESNDSLLGTDEIAAFCFNACQDTSLCIRQCPAEESCQNRCKNNQNEEQCRKDYCEYGGTAASCAFLCAGKDESCYESCSPTPECEDSCISKKATCFRNCLSTWNQCTDEFYSAGEGQIPCSLCGGEGLCSTNTELPLNENELILYGADGQKYECDLNCSAYPPECVTSCEEFFEDETSQMQCLSRCLDQYLFWCNDFVIPTDYVDSQGKQPCCFESYCNNALNSVVKTYDVECFNDTSCSSGKSCSPTGVCVLNNSSNCSGVPSTPGKVFIWLLLPMACLAFRRKRGRHA